MTKNQRTSIRRKAVITEARKLGLSLDTPRGRSQSKATVKQTATIALMTGDARERDVSKSQKRRIAAAHEALGSKLKTKRTKFDNMGDASDYWRQTLAPALTKHGLTI